MTELDECKNCRKQYCVFCATSKTDGFCSTECEAEFALAEAEYKAKERFWR